MTYKNNYNKHDNFRGNSFSSLKYFPRKKVRLFTHNDLDGYAAYIVARCYFPKEDIFVEYCTHENIDDRLEHFMKTITYNVDYVFITDIAMKTIKTANKIEICNILMDDVTVKLLDHHKDALFLNEYSFADVEIERNGEFICGSMLFYKYLTGELNFPRNITLEKWLKIVNDYDTWLWEDKYHYELPKLWNELFFFYERNLFVENTLKKIQRNNLEFSNMEKTYLDLEHGKQKSYIKSRIKNSSLKTIQGYKCAIVFGEQYINELATALYEEFPESEIQIIITGKNISYRSRNKELAIDLNEFASHFDGGGHENAAGSPITNKMRDAYLNMLFSLEE